MSPLILPSLASDLYLLKIDSRIRRSDQSTENFIELEPHDKPNRRHKYRSPMHSNLVDTLRKEYCISYILQFIHLGYSMRLNKSAAVEDLFTWERHLPRDAPRLNRLSALPLSSRTTNEVSLYASFGIRHRNFGI